jgi:Domain of unknown function (DUF4349)
MVKLTYVFASALLVVMLAACSKSQEEAPAADAPTSQVAEAIENDAAPAESGADASSKAVAKDDAEIAQAQAVTPEQLSSTAATYVDSERKFVRTANARFRVKDVYQSAMTIENVVASQGGFVVKNDIRSEVENIRRYPKDSKTLLEFTEFSVRGDLSVRVPSAKTQDFLRAIANQIEFLNNRNFAAQDVQFNLLRQHLEYQRNQETQRQLGDIAQSPGKVADRADVVSSQLDVKAQRDEAIVQRKEVEDKVSFSTIDLSLYQLSKVQKAEVANVDAMIDANRPGFFSQLMDAMSTGWRGFLALIIALSTVWPLWLLLAAGVYLVRYLFKRKKV